MGDVYLEGYLDLGDDFIYFFHFLQKNGIIWKIIVKNIIKLKELEN